jgi:hypothetical protein
MGLHARLARGDATAAEGIAKRLLARLVKRLANRFPRTDAVLVSDGVTDALLEYFGKPVRFDVGRRVPLENFLGRAARCNLSNLLRAEERRKRREEWTVAEARILGQTSHTDLEAQRLAGLRERLEALAKGLAAADQELLDFWLDGHWRTAEWAREMGLGHLPREVQACEVKRAKDRLIKRVGELQRKCGSGI